MQSERYPTVSSVLKDPSIPAPSKVIFALLVTHPEGLNKTQLAMFTGVSEQTVSRRLMRLPSDLLRTHSRSGTRRTLYNVPVKFSMQRRIIPQWDIDYEKGDFSNARYGYNKKPEYP